MKRSSPSAGTFTRNLRRQMQADLQASRRDLQTPRHSKAIRQLTFLPTMMMICRFNFNFEYFVNFSRELHSCVHFFDLLGGIMKGGFKNGIY